MATNPRMPAWPIPVYWGWWNDYGMKNEEEVEDWNEEIEEIEDWNEDGNVEDGNVEDEGGEDGAEEDGNVEEKYIYVHFLNPSLIEIPKRIKCKICKKWKIYGFAREIITPPNEEIYSYCGFCGTRLGQKDGGNFKIQNHVFRCKKMTPSSRCRGLGKCVLPVMLI